MLKIKTLCQLTIMRQDVINGGEKRVPQRNCASG